MRFDYRPRIDGPATATSARARDTHEHVDAAPAVAVEGLRKAFRLPHERRATLKERIVDRLRRRPDDMLPALDGVSFQVAHGEFLGIVGRNGSGKSTLLKCIAGIFEADSGRIAVAGELSPFVDLGVGFEGELTARENALISGVMLGLSRSEVRARFPAMLEFAGLESFADMKLKNFSSGMAVRLSFAVAIQADADVLLIDEVLAVGDAAFQQKCFDEFARLKREGRTILFVTHDMGSVARFCDRAILLEAGRVVDAGDPAAIARRYEQVNAESDAVRAPVASDADATVPDGAPERRYRPSALGESLRRLTVLTLTLAQLEFKLHYVGSILGYLWSVMRPLMLFAVTYFVFTRVGSFDEGVEDYAVYLLSSLVLWTFFAESTSGAATSLLRHQSLLRKLRFPRIAIPASVVVKSLFNLGLNLLAVAVLVAASGVTPRWSWLELPLLIALLALFAVGVAMLLAALFVRFRDVAQIWAVALQVLFFGSSVLYVVTDLPRNLQQEAVANPLAMIFTEMRHALIDPGAPTAADVAGGPAGLLIPLAVIAGVVALGAWAFLRESPRMAENV